MANALQLTYGGLGHFPNAVPAANSTHTIDANNDWMEQIFQAQESMTVTRLGCLVTSITAPPIYRISLQSVTRGATTRASGVVLAAGTWTPTATWQWVNVTTPVAITRGEWYAVVIEYSSGTIGASNRAIFGSYNLGLNTLNPNSVTVNASAATIGSTACFPIFGYGTAAKAYGFPNLTAGNSFYFTTSTPDEYAIKFRVPADVASTYNVLGIKINTAPQALNSTLCKVILYGGTSLTPADSNGAVTEDTIYQEMSFALCDLVTTSTRAHVLFFDEATLAELVGGAWYRIGVQPQGASGSGIQQSRISVANIDDWEAWPGGSNIGLSTRQDGGDWTDDPLYRPFTELILDKVTQPLATPGTLATVSRLQIGAGAPLNPTAAPGVTLFPIDSATDALEFMFQAEEAMTIAFLGCRHGVITGTPPSYKISLQGIASTGAPDGVILGGGTPASKVFTPAVISTWNWHQLDNPIAVTRGQNLAVVIKYNAGTINASNFSSFGVENAGFVGSNPYAATVDAGARTISTNSFLPVFGYATSGKAKRFGFPQQTNTGVLYHAGSSPNEYAIKFTIPTNICTTFRVLGVRWIGLTPVLNADVSAIRLYSGPNPATSIGAIDEKTQQQGGSFYHSFLTSTSYRLHEWLFGTNPPVTLYAGATYRLGFVPISGANGITIIYQNVPEAADFEAYSGGQNFSVSHRTGSGDWTDIPTACIYSELIIAEMAGPTSLLIHPGMSGRLAG